METILRLAAARADALLVQMHPDQLTVGVATVAALVAEQFPAWGGLPVSAVNSQGTVNAVFRLGEHIVLRFPLQATDASDARSMVDSEAAAAAELLGRTRFPTPEPIAIGEPGFGYPMPWLAMTWLTGTVVTEQDPSSWTGLAHDLAEFINDVRRMDTRGRVFRGHGRGGDLHGHDAWVNTCLDRSGSLLDVPAHRRVWRYLRDLPRISAEVVTHGDLIPGNLLVSNRRLAGVLDVGNLGPADPALDLVCAWHLFDDGPRQALRQDLDSDDLEWNRGKAWAFQQAMGTIWYYADSNPPMSSMGRRTLQRILDDHNST